jgi:hypothetical protein
VQSAVLLRFAVTNSEKRACGLSKPSCSMIRCLVIGPITHLRSGDKWVRSAETVIGWGIPQQASTKILSCYCRSGKECRSVGERNLVYGTSRIRIFDAERPDVVVGWVGLRLRHARGSNIGPETYPEVFSNFPWVPKAKHHECSSDDNGRFIPQPSPLINHPTTWVYKFSNNLEATSNL